MNDLKSIKRSVKILRKKKAKFILLHCKSEYPADIKGLKLDFINILKKEFPGVLVGYSDHSLGMIPSISALAKGACIIEKHFTDSKSRKGPDIICSMDPKDLKFLIESSKIIFYSNGKKKSISALEKKTAEFAFSSVVSIKKILKGDKLTNKNIWVKRPGKGYYKAYNFNSLLGKKAKRNISINQFIKKSDV